MPEPKSKPTQEQIEAAKRKLAESTDKVAVLREFPWLAELLNNPKTKPE